MSDAAISSFVDVTGTSTAVARRFVNLTGGDVEQAIMLFFENPDIQHTLDQPSSRPPAATGATATSTSQRGVREDDQGVITIDSDDDDDRDTNMTLDEDTDGDDVAVVNAVARNAQEEEDAAMAQRLQQELFASEAGAGAGGGDPDAVRSPIRSTHDTLVAPLPGWSVNSDHSDMEADVMDQLQRRRPARSRPNPFSQNIWDNENDRAAPGPPGTHRSRAQRLADLFRPPFELMSRRSWDEARDEGKEDKKWLLVNVQDMSDFNCQALNRDIWKDEAVQELVKQNFLFLQYNKEDHMAREYLNFYFKNHDDMSNYPHVAIVDPRTGEQVKVWSGRPFPSPLEFHSQLAEFLERYSLAANSKNPVVRAKAKPAQVVDVDRMTEDEQLEMALQASLASNDGGSARGGSGGGGASGASGASGRQEGSRQSTIIDPDSLTKSPMPKNKELPSRVSGSLSGALADSASRGALAGEQSPPPESEQQSQGGESSAFAGISSSNPHEEPQNDPATTTRIQFRHATGRIIRRFRTQDRVERLYEWLKAEPMEGKDGIEFELKKMPQGQDLLGSIGQTIEEAGLKQGTVMIEFME